MGSQIGRQNDQMAAGFGKLEGAVGTVRGALGALGIGISASAVIGFTKSTIAWADSLTELSERIGIGVEAIQRLQQAGELAGQSQEQISNNLEMFARRVGDAARGTGELRKVLEESGIALRDQDGNLRSTTSIFEDYAAKIGSAASEQEALSLAVAGFGRSGAEMVTVLKTLSQSSAEFQALTTEQVALLGKYDDQIGKVSQTLSFELKKGLVTSIAEIERIVAAFRLAIDAAQKMAQGLEEAFAGRLEGAMAGVAAKTQGVTDAFAAMYNAVVGQSYVPDMVREIEGWMERLDEVMVKPVDYATTRTIAAFSELPGHIRSSLIESQGEIKGWQETLAKGQAGLGRLQGWGWQEALAEGPTDADADRMMAPLETAAQSLSDTFADTFANILQEGVTSFEQLGDSVGRIFTNLTANIGQQFGASFTTLGAFGGPLGSLGGAALGIGAMFGLSKLGSAFGLGGGPQSNDIKNMRGLLGAAGTGGTGAAAGIVRDLDKQLLVLLDARQEQLVNAALAVAPGVSVKYSKQPSANDLASLARGRLGPTAQALGFNATAVATGSAEQQFANLQTAVALFRQIEDFRIGPIATQFRNLDETFAETAAEANRLGVSTVGLADAYGLAHAALTRQIRLEQIAVAEQVGALSPLDAQLQALEVNMQAAAARAQELGISTANVGETHHRAAQALIEQDRVIRQQQAEQARQASIQAEQQALQARLQRNAVAEAVGAFTPLQRALADLAVQAQIARAEAESLGISVANLARELHIQTTILTQQDRLRQHDVMQMVGAVDPLGRALGDLDAQMQIAKHEAMRLGISVANVGREFGIAQGILIQQDRLQRHALMETLGAWTATERAINDLHAQLNIAAAEAKRLGFDMKTVNEINRTFALGARRLQQENRLQVHALWEQIGLISPLTRALGDLDAQMQLARIEAERLGYSTANIAQEHHRLADALIRENQAAQDQLALSITSPFEGMLDPLREFFGELTVGNLNPAGQMAAAAEEFRRIAALATAGSTVAIGQLRGAGEAFIAQAERFGASPGGVAARTEVSSVIEQVIGSVEQAQRDASAGLENVIRQASQREVDTLHEMIAEVRIVAEEIRRNRRV